MNAIVAIRPSTARGSSRGKTVIALHSSYARCLVVRHPAAPICLPGQVSDGVFQRVGVGAWLWNYAAPVVALAALAARAFARFATSAAFRAGDNFRFGAALFAAVFFCAAGFVFAAAPWTAAHLFFVASEIAFLPATLILRFGFATSVVAGASGSDSPFSFAHLAFCPRAIRLLAAAEILRFLVRGSGVAAGVGLVGPPSNMARSSAICTSMCRFCSSNPRMAAVSICGLSVVGMCNVLSGFSLSCLDC